MANLITEDNLGAWLIKCDPEAKFDLPRAIDAGLEVVDDWSVRPGYRASMMKPQDRVILWVSGSGKRMTRGIWGVGYVTNFVRDSVFEELEPDEDTFWHSEEHRLAVTHEVEVDIPLFESGTELSAVELVAAGIVDLEVQRQPQMPNPSWVNAEQLAEIEALLEDWPDYIEPDERVTVSPRGAGFGDPVQNAAVEAAAMEAVIDYYEGWRPLDVSKNKCGWDITFTNEQSKEVARVEVKGVSGQRPIVLLTANEMRAAAEEDDWYLAVVTKAIRDPTVVEYDAEDALAAASPYVFKAHMPEA